MEDVSRRISVLAEGTSNVLIIELQPDEILSPYCCKMVENNVIPGLLSMKHQFVDGVMRLRYSIGGRIPLREFMMQNRLSYEKGVLLLRNLSTALLHLDEYFLSPDMCYLNPEYVYVGDGLRVFLPCIPIEREQPVNFSIRLKSFYEKLLSEFFATADSTAYDGMFKWVYKTTLFDLETFCQMFLKEEKQEPQLSVQPSAPVRPFAPAAAEPGSVQPVGAPQENAKNVPPQVNEMAWASPALPNQPPQNQAGEFPADKSLAVPGGMTVPIPDSQGSGRQKKEKRKGWPFSSHSDKADKAPDTAPEYAVPPEPAASMQQEQAVSASQLSQGQYASQSLSGEKWDDGTILVSSLPSSPAPLQAPTAGESRTPYFFHKGKRIDITQTPFVVGKYNTTCPLHYALFDNNRISRSHATFLYEQGKYYIRDNQSRNGTSLNGRSLVPLQPVELKDGDEIRLYDEFLEFHLV